MIEVDADTTDTAIARITDLIPDARVWHPVDPVDAALLVFDVPLVAAA